MEMLFKGSGYEELAESLEDFEDDFVRKIQNSVANVKASREMEERFMLLEELINDERKEAKAEGKVEGKAEAVIEFLQELGEVPEELVNEIMGETNLDVLRLYLKKASNANSVEAFREEIRK